MENKINIAEILKDCPKGTKLYSPLCGECRLMKIYDSLGFDVINGINDVFNFSYDGRYNLMGDCCIFPSKEQRDWSKFQKPFKDGDIISNGRNIAIFHNVGNPKNFVSSNVVYYHCWYNHKYNDFKAKIDFGIGTVEEFKYATEEEKQKLFKAIEDNGYKWNTETKTLEKLVEPKFKVGDRVVKKDGISVPIIITGVGGTYYWSAIENSTNVLPIADQDDWELVPNKFDITTLKPFKSKVLVRNCDSSYWRPAIFGFTEKDKNDPFYVVGGNFFNKCIPYEGNEHLLGTTKDCDEYYKV